MSPTTQTTKTHKKMAQSITTLAEFKALLQFMTPDEYETKYGAETYFPKSEIKRILDFDGMSIEELKNGEFILILDRSQYKSTTFGMLIKRLWFEFAQYEYGASMAGVHTSHETTKSLEEINIQTKHEFKCKSWGHDACDSVHNEDLDIEIYFPNHKEDINTFQVAKISTADELLITTDFDVLIRFIDAL